MNNISKKICDFPNYIVTTDGNIFNKNGIKLKQQKTRNGYLRVSLSNNSVKHKHMLVHRLVAKAFIPNPNNLPQVNHINQNKTDNRVENLEWCTALENLNHSNIIEKASVAKFTKVQCVTTGEIFNSIKEAANKYKLHHSNIVACCNNRRQKCGGMEWKYYTVGEDE